MSVREMVERLVEKGDVEYVPGTTDAIRLTRQGVKKNVLSHLKTGPLSSEQMNLAAHVPFQHIEQRVALLREMELEGLIRIDDDPDLDDPIVARLPDDDRPWHRPR